MDQLFSLSAFSALGQVILIDIALAADNAVVIGLAAAGLEPQQRKKAILWGIIAATVMRIAFASITVQLLQIIGLVLAGGILLLWVCWKMWAELHPEGLRAALSAWRERRRNGDAAVGEAGHGAEADGIPDDGAPRKSMRQAITQIVIADISMSLDNVLAVAGAAREHPYAMIFGLALSIAMMGAASMAIARLLERHRWIAYAGLAVVFYVAVKMIIEGGEEVLHSGVIG
jgi:YjbE family integral membrane protein